MKRRGALFKKHLQTVPSKYYLELRLEKARQMLRRSDKPVLQVGLACGFSSASYFSTAYRNHYGLTPREERKRMQDGDTSDVTAMTHRSALLSPDR